MDRKVERRHLRRACAQARCRQVDAYVDPDVQGPTVSLADRADETEPALVSASVATRDLVLREQAMALFCTTAPSSICNSALRRTAAGRPGPEGSALKVHGARSFKRRVELLARARGTAALRTDGDGYVDLLTAPSMSIRGGTDEIQLSIIGERILGLPAEPRVDRDVSWTESRHGGIRQR